MLAVNNKVCNRAFFVVDNIGESPVISVMVAASGALLLHQSFLLSDRVLHRARLHLDDPRIPVNLKGRVRLLEDEYMP